MTHKFALTILAMSFSCSLCLLPAAPARAQKGNRNQQDEKRENARVADAQRQVREHQAALSASEQKLRTVLRSVGTHEATLSKSRSHWRETRERVGDDMAKSMGIEAALTRLKQAKAQLATYSQPIWDKLHATDAWRDTRKNADDAKLEIEKLREDIQLADAERSAKINELTKLVLRPNELDKQAVLDTPEGKKLTDQVSSALSAIEKIRQAIPGEKVDNDPAVVKAKKAVDQAEQELQKQTRSLSAQRVDVQKSQQQLVASRQKLQQAQAADARDKNRK